MGHLSIEVLARIVSEAPTPEEQIHLGECSDCASELRAMIEQTEGIGSLPDLRPPHGDWEALEARLVSEGLIRSSGWAGQASGRWSSRWFQAAAAVVLFLGGTALGSGVMARGDLPGIAQDSPAGGLELIPVGAEAQPISNLADAADAVNAAERRYMLALLQYRQMMDAQGEPTYVGDPTARFAAIEAILAASRAAIQQAPADPFVNGVLVSSLAEREAFLRNASLTPADGVF
ncbi:MAG: hypothetical protein HKO65_12055 [Gemmatimonadetes bacterium]|nr:hypothetical protein [Gemmatimonadota bacterium]NNM05813.1 hypothetical protein [Gemmatimonadota bacterium]